jgi:protein TonB
VPAGVKKPVAVAPEIPTPNAPRVRVAKPVPKPVAKPVPKPAVERVTSKPVLAAAARRKPPAAPPAAPVAPARTPAPRAPRLSGKKISPPTPVDLGASAASDAASAGLWPFPTGARP